MSVTTQRGSGQQYVKVLDVTFINIELCSECVLFMGALAHTILRVSYFVVVNLFTILIKTYLTIQFTLIRYNYCFETAFYYHT